MTKDVVRKKGNDYLYQILLVLLGACIGLGSSWITQSWRYSKERKELVNYIEGSVRNDIFIIDGFTDTLQQYLKDPSRNLSANTFRWQHEATFLQAITSRAGSLEMTVIIKLSKYFDMVEQSRAFRGVLRETLLSRSGDVARSSTELQAYIEVLKSQKTVGEDLLKEIEKTYR